MKQHKHKRGQSRAIRFTMVGLVCLGLLITLLLKGTDVALFDPKGLIASKQHRLMLFSVALLFEIGIPTLIIFYSVAWKYRESNQHATYDPNARHGKLFALSLWTIPTFFMVLLASMMWPAAHQLAPQKSIAADAKPLTVQVVALRWKWLFIYPEQQLATVNFVQIPVNTPVEFDLTADDAPMNSFWIPHLGGQLYAMTGHQNRLNLMASQTGDYTGSAAEINGAGFAGMKFTARVSSRQDFDVWAQGVKRSSHALDAVEYQKLLTPSENNAVAFYTDAEPNLYSAVLFKYEGSHNHTGQP